MSTKSVTPWSWRQRVRTAIPVALVVSISGLMATGLVSAVREARNAAHSATTT